MNHGKLTERSIVTGSRTKRYMRSIYEYRNAKLLIDIINEIIEPLKVAFPDDYHEIMAMGIVKILQPTCLNGSSGVPNRYSIGKCVS